MRRASFGPKDGLLVVSNLKKHFPVETSIMAKLISRSKRFVHAVDDVSFLLKPGETLGLVGESGSGKTTVGKLILGLFDPTAGTVYFEGKDTKLVKGSAKKALRKKMGVVFQDPYSSLNPRKNIKDIVSLPLRTHGMKNHKELEEKVTALLEQVGIDPRSAGRFPHMFSGGQRQRIAIARALATNPDLVVLDEPVSALDVSIQAQILNLLMELKEKYNLSYVFIAHNMSIVHRMSERIAVMYLGKIMETAGSDEIAFRPLHPYTQALMSVIPIPDPKVEWGGTVLEGEIPSPINPPPGCVFKTRCPAKLTSFGAGDDTICDTTEPSLINMGKDHYVACHLYSGDKKG
ncbi:MAG: ABC transporter ATP-binding protein, partial [Nitrososphaerales archaeon]